jgi:RNA polymerase sigma-70 factor (ECF subfamily)
LAQSEVYQLYAGKLFALCLKYSQNQQDAEDILQDSFITIFDKIKQYKSTGSFEGWMKRITINIALQKYRKQMPLQIIKEHSIEEESVDTDYENTVIEIDFLLEIIQQLPNRYRLVFNLYILDKFSHKEIAAMLNISESSSKSNLSRAKVLLKRKIEIHQQKKKEA